MKHLSKTQVDNIRKRELLKIGEFIKRRRTRQNVTQNDVAEVLSVNRAEISYYESGSRDMPISSFFVLGEALGFKLKDYVLDIEAREAVDLYEKAIYREVGKDKSFKMEYMTSMQSLGQMNGMYADKKKEMVLQMIEAYFNSDASEDNKTKLVLADMLYESVSDKTAMKSVYKSIVREVADTGNKYIDAAFKEYVSIVRNER